MYQLLKCLINRTTLAFSLLTVSLSLFVTHSSHAMNFQVQLESEADLPPGSGKELLYATYNSFADLVTFNQASSTFSPVDIIGTYSTTGLAFDGNKGGNGGVIPEPSTMLLFGTGLAGLAAWRWKRGAQA